jgi:hypothetical protein
LRISTILIKIRDRLWSEIVKFSRTKKYYPKLYKCYWHMQIFNTKGPNNSLNYYAAIPNLGAGIGHQISNWIAGYWFAKQFGLKFAHVPFSSDSWERFLGFGEDEQTFERLLAIGYKKIKLPLFDENDSEAFGLQRRIIQSYNGQKVVFVAEQDQFYQNQFGVITDIQKKFYASKARKNEELQFSSDYFNIAIHIRRGDIITGIENQNSNLKFRWQDNTYFEKVLDQVVENAKTSKPIAIYLFSQGKKENFSEFEKFSNLQFCLDWTAQDSFLHMVFSDVLITSRSSFSYKPALLSKGIKICPKDFWHGYPEGEDWILVDKDGVLKKI